MGRIGIVSFTLSDNAGAMLQLFSLYSFLKSKTNNVICIKYKNSRVYENQYPLHFFKELFRKPSFSNLKELVYWAHNHARYNLFRKKMKYSISVSPQNYERKIKLSLAIFGSDQILHFPLTNYDVNFLNGFNIIESPNKVMFSGSIGSFIPESNEVSIYKHAFQKLNYISFREKETCIFFEQKLGAFFEQTCDPTLLMGADFWKSFLSKRKYKKFVFLYYCTDLLLKKVIEYAEANDCLIYYSYPLTKIPHLNKRFIRVHDDPVNFLNYVYHSQYVFTSSYHCLVFSLIFNKKCFCPIDMRDERYKRLIDLMHNVDGEKGFSDINDNEREYNFYKKMSYLIKSSKEVLLEFIGKTDENEK